MGFSVTHTDSDSRQTCPGWALTLIFMVDTC